MQVIDPISVNSSNHSTIDHWLYKFGSEQNLVHNVNFHPMVCLNLENVSTRCRSNLTEFSRLFCLSQSVNYRLNSIANKKGVRLICFKVSIAEHINFYPHREYYSL